MMTRPLQAITFATLVILAWPLGVAAQERLCDTQYETDCRAQLLSLIDNEPASGGINVAYWSMEDARYVTHLTNAHNRGVPIRILVDERASNSKPANAQILAALKNAGIPIREKIPDPTYAIQILHFKTMQFLGQGMLEFSKANYSGEEFVPIEPNVNYADESIFFTNDVRLLNSFRRRFDDRWIDTSVYQNYANISGPLVRECPIEVCVLDPAMNFPPLQNFAYRAKGRIDAEPAGGQIDAFVFRVTDHLLPDAVISAVKRGVTVRLVSDPTEYRNPTRLWDAAHIDRMWINGVRVKMGTHGSNAHQASIVLRRLGEVIFGSSNWTTPSAIKQDEHNFFYKPGFFSTNWFFQWFADQFDRRWNDATNYPDLVPLPPGTPTYAAPGNGASGIGTSVTLKWEGGPWAHFYDIYFGTSSNPPLLASNQQLGSPDPGSPEKYTVSNLLPGTTYYWRIVGKTWAQKTKAGPLWSFVTSGTPSTSSRPYGGTPVALPGTVQAENFDYGGQNVAYYDTSPGNVYGAYRSTDVDIEASSGGYDVAKVKAGEWLLYTVNVATTGTYQFQARVATVGSGATLRLFVDGTDVSGSSAISAPDTGDWHTWTNTAARSVSLTAGQHAVKVYFATVSSSGGGSSLDSFTFAQ